VEITSPRPAGLQYLALPSLGLRLSPVSSSLRGALRSSPQHSFVLVAVIALVERGTRKVSDDCHGGRDETGGETARGSGMSGGGEARDGKAAFESHPRTPSGLKESIKRREPRHGGRQANSGWKERKRESWGPASRLLCQVDEAGKDENTKDELAVIRGSLQVHACTFPTRSFVASFFSFSSFTERFDEKGRETLDTATRDSAKPRNGTVYAARKSNIFQTT